MATAPTSWSETVVAESTPPIHERFHVHLDHRGVLRTDHELRLYRALVLRLHYRLEPV